ncbi:MAG: membrane protein insertion efficiency factor YidD [bacterium]|nr:membrane protein insertion efficiency factor YidD [bacterium]
MKSNLPQIALKSIRVYQKYLSFDTGLLRFLFVTEGTCRFEPRCSEYTYQAIQKYGILLGVWMGLKRILRCHPWSKGGLDPLK